MSPYDVQWGSQSINQKCMFLMMRLQKKTGRSWGSVGGQARLRLIRPSYLRATPAVVIGWMLSMYSKVPLSKGSKTPFVTPCVCFGLKQVGPSHRWYIAPSSRPLKFAEFSTRDSRACNQELGSPEIGTYILPFCKHCNLSRQCPVFLAKIGMLSPHIHLSSA